MGKNIIFSNRKADISGRKMIFYIVFSFVAAITFMLIVYLTDSGRSKIADIPSGLEDYLLIQRFLSSSNCFAYQDADSGRTEHRSIDLQKFNEINLNKCYDATDTKIKAFRLTLSYGNSKNTINTKNWEGFVKRAETRVIDVYDGQIRQMQAELFIEVQYAK